jgi:hypothetical protein
MKGSAAMSKFNQKTVGAEKTVNNEGHVAYKMEDKEKLVTQVLTTFFAEPKYYASDGNSVEIVELAKEMASKDPLFVAKLAVFARREFNMRSITHVLSAILAHDVKGKEVTRKTIPAVVVRADDMTEILAYYLQTFGKPIPNSLKKGLNDAIVKFDEYALAKYKGENKGLAIRDVMRLCRPVPKSPLQAELFKRCIDMTLATPYTWETQLSERGNTKEVWEELIASGQVGYMALLRNLRNILKSGASNTDIVFNRLSDPIQVQKSKQFPFQFLSAYKELEGIGATSKVFDTLEDALDASIMNIPRIAGKTAIVCDVSASMKNNTVSAKSKMRCSDVGLLFGVMAARICEESVFMTFDTNLYHPTVSSRGGILQQCRSLQTSGGGTYMNLPFEYLIQNKVNVDRIVILSDNEVNSNLIEDRAYYGLRGGSSYKPIQGWADEYRRRVNQNAWVHAIDLQGYGTQQFKGNRVNIISGWSEKVLGFIPLVEQGADTLVKRIESYEF